MWLKPEPWSRADEALRDGYLRLQADPQLEERLVIVDIDEVSLQQIGTWPWSRTLLADLAESLLIDGGARAVAFDMVLPEPADVAGDTRLATLSTNTPLVLAHMMDPVARDEPNRTGILAADAAMQITAGALTASGYIANHAGLARARCIGNISYLPDNDGVLRHLPAKIRFGNLTYLPLAAALLRCTDPDIRLPVPNLQGQWRIPYLHSGDAYMVVPAADILRGNPNQHMFRGRYVIIGSSALGLYDRVATPLQALAPGILVHAQGISGLLDISQGRARAPWDGTNLAIGWTAVSILLAVLAVGNLNAWRGTMTLVSLTFLWIALSWIGVARQGEFSITAPLTAYFLTLLTSIPFEWWRSQLQTRNLINIFSQYVAKPVVEQLSQLKLQQTLTPIQCEVTVLIADMEGYTRATSELSLSDAANLTKEFLTCITNSVLAEGGTLDKYTGDGLVAFWGAPVPSSDHADQAVTAGLAMLTAVALWNKRRIAKGRNVLRVRVGIETGRALVGDLGTDFRSSYTAVGDCINLAARLEAEARNLPSDLVIGPRTQARLKRHQTRSLGFINLRGMPTEIEVFSPIELTE